MPTVAQTFEASCVCEDCNGAAKFCIDYDLGIGSDEYIFSVGVPGTDYEQSITVNVETLRDLYTFLDTLKSMGVI